MHRIRKAKLLDFFFFQVNLIWYMSPHPMGLMRNGILVTSASFYFSVPIPLSVLYHAPEKLFHVKNKGKGMYVYLSTYNNRVLSVALAKVLLPCTLSRENTCVLAWISTCLDPSPCIFLFYWRRQAAQRCVLLLELHLSCASSHSDLRDLFLQLKKTLYFSPSSRISASILYLHTFSCLPLPPPSKIRC